MAREAACMRLCVVAGLRQEACPCRRRYNPPTYTGAARCAQKEQQQQQRRGVLKRKDGAWKRQAAVEYSRQYTPARRLQLSRASVLADREAYTLLGILASMDALVTICSDTGNTNVLFSASRDAVRSVTRKLSTIREAWMLF